MTLPTSCAGRHLKAALLTGGVLALAACGGTATPVTEAITTGRTVSAPAEAQAVVAAYEAVLQARIVDGPQGLTTFDYAAAAADGDLEAIKAYTAHLAAQTPSTMSDDEAVSYWANLYNALTLQVVLENYPVETIKDIGAGGPWKSPVVNVEGRTLTLDDIEHGTMRAQFPSPYIHYMVNCASVGCPNLRPTLWSAQTLEADRNAAANAFINSPRGASVDEGEGEIDVSSLYKWFKEDFGGSEEGIIAHLSDHATGELAQVIAAGAEIDDYDYDWSLNAPNKG